MSEAVTAPTGKQRSCHSCGTLVPPEDSVCPSCKTPFVETQTANAAAGEKTNLGIGETLLGQWKLESKIGEGGMGNVFLATELKLGRKVAVKALSVDNLQDETMKRFEREAQVMGKLDHPNIVTLYAVGRHRDIPFLVMRYLEGGSLWDLLDANGGRLTAEQLLPLVKQLCSALGYIHGKNLIHRDLKPSNIFISPQGKVTLLDLGLARGHTTALTRTGIIWGTPDFMAPEQIVGEKQLDGRADLYALGVVLYRMISNQPPFPDEDDQDLMRAHLTKPRPDITKAWTGATPALSLMLQKAMAIKPEERFQNAEEFAQAFDRVVNAREQSTRGVPATAPAAPAAAASNKPVIGPVVTPMPAPRPSVPQMKAVSAATGGTGTNPAHAPTAAAPAAPAPPKAAGGTGANPAHAPAAGPPMLKPTPVTTAPPQSLTNKHKVVDELDDDATELGELSPELLELINSDTATATARPSDVPGGKKPTGPPPKAPEAIPRKSQVQVPRASAPPPGAVPADPGLSPSRTSGVTAVDRPANRPALATTQPLDSGIRASVPTRPEGYQQAVSSKAAEPDTGPEQVVVQGTLDPERPSAPVMVSTMDIEPQEEEEPKTEIGPSPAEGSTTVGAVPQAADIDRTKAEPSPRGGTTPAPRMSAPKGASRKSAIEPAVTRESAAEEPADESPPWMHPYVLVTGGLLLLALGFLIGVLLR